MFALNFHPFLSAFQRSEIDLTALAASTAFHLPIMAKDECITPPPFASSPSHLPMHPKVECITPPPMSTSTSSSASASSSPSSASHLHFKKRFAREYLKPVPVHQSAFAPTAGTRVILSPHGAPSCCSRSETGSLDSGFADLEPLDLSYSSSSSPKASDSSPSPSSGFGHGKFSCTDCGKIYKSASQYRAHVRRHESKMSGRYSCTVCNKNFVQRSSLKTHERIHTGEKPYHCNLCDERFGDFSTFTKHRRTHTGEKPYDCPVCKRSFSQSGNMHRHLKVVHKSEFLLYANLLEESEGDVSVEL